MILMKGGRAMRKWMRLAPLVSTMLTLPVLRPAGADVTVLLSMDTILGTKPLEVAFVNTVILSSPHFWWQNYTPKRQKVGGQVEMPLGTIWLNYTGYGTYQELFILEYPDPGDYNTWATDTGLMSVSFFPFVSSWTRDTNNIGIHVD
jgi:hypothetical protein